MPGYRFVEEIGSMAMVATKSSVDVEPESNFRKHVTHTPLLSPNKALKLSDPKSGISGPTKKTHVLQIFLKKYTMSQHDIMISFDWWDMLPISFVINTHTVFSRRLSILLVRLRL